MKDVILYNTTIERKLTEYKCCLYVMWYVPTLYILPLSHVSGVCELIISAEGSRLGPQAAVDGYPGGRS